MGDNRRVTKYLVKFNRLAARIQWGDAALRRQFYNGLLARIKDEVAHVGKPGTLHELRTLTQSIDACYWERRSEVARESNSNKTTDHSHDKGKTPTTPSTNSNDNWKTSNNNGNKPSTSGTTLQNANTQKKSADLASKLGKDGKLTQQERQHRFEQNLCLFCGRTGHVAKECLKSTSSAAKGRAVSTTDNKSPDKKNSDAKTASDSKNS